MDSQTPQCGYYTNLLNEDDIFIEFSNEISEHQEASPQVEVQPTIKNRAGVATSLYPMTICLWRCGFMLLRMPFKEIGKNTRFIGQEFVTTFSNTRHLDPTVIRPL
jgi:hypothetical protein